MKLLAPKTVARLCGVTTSRVQQWDREGQLRALRDSEGRRYFTEEAVQAFLQERHARQTEPARRR